MGGTAVVTKHIKDGIQGLTHHQQAAVPCQAVSEDRTSQLQGRKVSVGLISQTVLGLKMKRLKHYSNSR